MNKSDPKDLMYYVFSQAIKWLKEIPFVLKVSLLEDGVHFQKIKARQ